MGFRKVSPDPKLESNCWTGIAGEFLLAGRRFIAAAEERVRMVLITLAPTMNRILSVDLEKVRYGDQVIKLKEVQNIFQKIFRMRAVYRNDWYFCPKRMRIIKNKQVKEGENQSQRISKKNG